MTTEDLRLRVQAANDDIALGKLTEVYQKCDAVFMELTALKRERDGTIALILEHLGPIEYIGLDDLVRNLLQVTVTQKALIITSEELKQNAQEMLDEWFQADRDALNAKLEQNAIEYEYVTFTSNTTNVPAAAGQERQLQSEPKLEPKPSIVTLEPKKRMITLEE